MKLGRFGFGQCCDPRQIWRVCLPPAQKPFLLHCWLRGMPLLKSKRTFLDALYGKQPGKQLWAKWKDTFRKLQQKTIKVLTPAFKSLNIFLFVQKQWQQEHNITFLLTRENRIQNYEHVEAKSNSITFLLSKANAYGLLSSTDLGSIFEYLSWKYTGIKDICHRSRPVNKRPTLKKQQDFSFFK